MTVSESANGAPLGEVIDPRERPNVPALGVGDWLAERTAIGAPALTGFLPGEPPDENEPGNFFPVSRVIPLPLTLPADDYPPGHPRTTVQSLQGDERIHPEAARRMLALLTIMAPVYGAYLPSWDPRPVAPWRMGGLARWAYERGAPCEQDRKRAEPRVAALPDRLRTIATRNQVYVVSTAPVRRQDRALLRAVFAAMSTDLGDDDLDAVARRNGLTSFLDEQRRKDAQKLTDRGRMFLGGVLGVWPWVHTEHGRLPTDWRTSPAFTAPLERWHAAAIRAADEQLDRQRRLWP